MFFLRVVWPSREEGPSTVSLTYILLPQSRKKIYILGYQAVQLKPCPQKLFNHLSLRIQTKKHKQSRSVIIIVCFLNPKPNKWLSCSSPAFTAPWYCPTPCQIRGSEHRNQRCPTKLPSPIPSFSAGAWVKPFVSFFEGLCVFGLWRLVSRGPYLRTTLLIVHGKYRKLSNSTSSHLPWVSGG